LGALNTGLRFKITHVLKFKLSKLCYFKIVFTMTNIRSVSWECSHDIEETFAVRRANVEKS